MTCAHPDRPVKARGLCAPCYSRQWRLAHLDRARSFVAAYGAAHRAERLAYFAARRAQQHKESPR